MRIRTVLLVVVAAVLSAPSSAPAPPVTAAAAEAEEAEVTPTWAEVERLIDLQRLQAALEVVLELRGQAVAEGRVDDWTRALAEETRLRTALGGFESAIRELRSAPWPDDPRSRLVLDLVLARAMETALDLYSWEIAEREEVGAGGDDPATWTAARYAAEIDAAFADAWSAREAWGGEPLRELSGILEPNGFPDRIRGTLRDAVSYLWVDRLADTSLWSPAELNGAWTLDLEPLLGGEPGVDPAADEDAHPLAKLAAVLADLEAWHRASSRPEAALEAALERAERVRQAPDREADRRRVAEHVAARLQSFDRALPWWSRGQAVLAGMLQQGEAPDALIRARDAAAAGAEAHPGSFGGRQCRALVARLEGPTLELAAMESDAPGRRSIRLTHSNLGRAFFRAWRVDLEQRLREGSESPLLPRADEVERLVHSRKPDASWSVGLPPTPDLRPHATDVVPPMTAPGAWLVAVSRLADFAPEGNRLAAVVTVLGDPVILTRDGGAGWEVEVVSGSDGAPLSGAAVTLWRYDWRSGHHPVESRRTGADGRVRFAARQDHGGHVVLASHRGEIAVADGHLSPRYRPEDRTRRSALVWTDRSVYRPGQALLWKVVAWEGRTDEGRFRTVDDLAVTVTLNDANGEGVAEEEVVTNAFGTASGRFEIPAGRLLGGWSVQTSLGGSAEVLVEEYKRPTFEVEITDPESELRLNRETAFAGEARYYFGLPVSEGRVSWTVTREPAWPPWWGWWRPRPDTAPELVAAGEAELAADGSFRVVFTPAADEREAAGSGVSYRFRLAADVTEPGGETRSAERVFRLGFVSIEARLEPGAGFLRAGAPAAVTARRTDLDGVPRPGQGRWRLVALAQPGETPLPAELPPDDAPLPDDPYATEGDRRRARWQTEVDPDRVLAAWDEAREVAAGEVEHGADGAAEIPLPALEPGAYRLLYATEDAFGAVAEARRELVVSGPKRAPVAVPLLLAAERDEVAPGGVLRLLVHSGLAGLRMTLEIQRPGREIERRTLTAGAGSAVLEIPVDARDRGGIAVALTALADHQLMRETETVHVPWRDRRLEISFSSFRDRMRPGTEESFRITVKGPDQRAVDEGAVELLASMYDRSLDLFAFHEPRSPLGLYPSRASIPPLRVTLGTAPVVWRAGQPVRPDVPVPPQPDRIATVERYGIGGPGARGRFLMKTMAMAAAPMEADAVGMATRSGEADDEAVMAEAVVAAGEPAPEVELRSEFAETAFFAPHLLTGPDGAATVEFTVPDSVTEWVVWVEGITRDLAAGSARRTARSVKDLMVRPVLPRFLREGDRAELAVTVNNAGEEPLAGTLDLALVDAETGDDLGPDFGLGLAAGVPFAVEPGGGQTLTFPVTAPRGLRTVAVEARARAGELGDGERRPLPVLPGRTHLAVSRTAALSEGASRELVAPASIRVDDPTRVDERLVVTVDAQLVMAALKALPYLRRYPYECVEQTLNRSLSAGIVAALADRVPLVAKLAEEAAARQTRLEPWDAGDPNRRMALEETPWLDLSRGGGDDPDDLINVLDPRIARAEHEAAVAKLEQAQTAAGAFPWWPGGPPSRYMTLYVLAGFARGLEFGVEAPRDVVERGWRWLAGEWAADLKRRAVDEDCCWQEVAFLAYVLTSYPDLGWTGGAFSEADLAEMLDLAEAHWRDQPPRVKCLLTMALVRAGRREAAQRVFAAVMDSAKTDPDLGTYWMPEERAWLWYNDTVEGHALALRAMVALAPDDPRRHGLVQWLLLNRQLNQWQSTRTTAEVVYALVAYLEREGALGVDEGVTVAAGGRRARFEFPAEEAVGRRQLVVPGEELTPANRDTVIVTKRGPGLAFATATWQLSTERLPEAAEGTLFALERRVYRRVRAGSEWVLEPLAEGAQLAVGDQVEVHLVVRARHAAEFVHLRDPRAAGLEPERLTSGWRWDLGVAAYEEVRDSGTNFFVDWLPAGEYTLKHRLRAATAGTFRLVPATLQSMYAPQFAAFSAGASVEVRQR